VNRPIRIVIADGDQQFAQQIGDCLAQTSQIQLVGIAWDGPSLIECCAEIFPDIVLLDLQLPVIDGIKVIASILRADPQIGILTTSSVADQEDYGLYAIKLGAKGYLPKSDLPDNIISVIHQIFEGGVYVSSKLASQVLKEFESLAP